MHTRQTESRRGMRAMYCWSCGEVLPEGKQACVSCGAPTANALGLPRPPTGGSMVTDAPPRRRASPSSSPPGSPVGSGGVRMCPSCGYVGDGVPYFRRSAAAARLIGVGLVTLGIGAHLFWKMKRNSLACPSCGASWERARTVRGLPVRSLDTEWDLRLPPLARSSFGLPRGGLVQRTLGVIVVLLSFGVLGIGIGEANLQVVVFGVLVGILGAWSFASGWRALQLRRARLLRSLQARALGVAEVRGGRLTATELASDLDLSLPAAERVLFSMEDRVRVRSEFTGEGLLVFEFPEILLRSLSDREAYPDTEWMEE